MSQYTVPPAPIGYDVGEYPWIDWWNKVRLAASAGQEAYSVGIPSKLSKDVNDVLNGTITFNTLGAFKVGNITWNGSSATGTGVMFTANGLVSANAGTIGFVLKSDGTAIFSGALSAASGTFSGDVVTTGHLVATGNYTSGSYAASVIGQPSTTSQNGVLGITTSGIGIYGVATNGNGVYGIATSGGIGTVGHSSSGVGIWGETSSGQSVYARCTGSGVAVQAEAPSGGTAIYTVGPSIFTGQVNSTVTTGTAPFIVASTTQVSNLNAEKVSGHSTDVVYYNGTATPGTPGVPAGYIKISQIGGGDAIIAYYT